MTFARFMEMALFDPVDGYYSKGKAVEDYYTSPAAHPAFGALIALQLEQMWEITEKPENFTVVEMGAGRGLLAEDILDFAEQWSPDFYRSMRYIAIERGTQQTADGTQQTANGSTNKRRVSPVHGPESCAPIADVEARRAMPERQYAKLQVIRSNLIPLKNIVGCFLSNELVDSFPVHLLVKQKDKLEEIYVGLEGDKFKEVLRELSSVELEKYLVEQKVVLEEGQRIEVNLQALDWLHEVSKALRKGYILTIDYGHEAAQLYSRRFFKGTLMCYYRQNYTDNPFIRLGWQDITSHVNFTALMSTGDRLGLKTSGLIKQGSFLHNLGLEVFLKALTKLGLPQQEYYANQMALRNLSSTEGMGDFKVLIQGKNVRASSLYGLKSDNDLLEKLKSKDIPVPLLKPRHLSLLQASYPEYYFQP